MVNKNAVKYLLLITISLKYDEQIQEISFVIKIENLY